MTDVKKFTRHQRCVLNGDEYFTIYFFSICHRYLLFKRDISFPAFPQRGSGSLSPRSTIHSHFDMRQRTETAVSGGCINISWPPGSTLALPLCRFLRKAQTRSDVSRTSGPGVSQLDSRRPWAITGLWFLSVVE